MARYYDYRGKKVNKYWLKFLREAAQAGVSFQLNSGHRTLAEQWKLYRAYKAGGTLAAFPLPTAPHIKFNHACDIDMFAGDGVKAVVAFGAKHRVTLRYTVRTEGWHVEADKGDLKRFYERYKKAGK